MKILVCGGRNYGWLPADELGRKKPDMAAWDTLYGVLDTYLVADDDITIISGHAYGADQLAEAWADEREVPSMIFPAEWNLRGKAAGPIRNQRMLDEGKPDLVIAFPGGRGTDDMVARAEKAGVPVQIIPPTT
jgi:hypothetical protein